MLLAAAEPMLFVYGYCYGSICFCFTRYSRAFVVTAFTLGAAGGVLSLTFTVVALLVLLAASAAVTLIAVPAFVFNGNAVLTFCVSFCFADFFVVHFGYNRCICFCCSFNSCIRVADWIHFRCIWSNNVTHRYFYFFTFLFWLFVAVIYKTVFSFVLESSL